MDLPVGRLAKIVYKWRIKKRTVDVFSRLVLFPFLVSFHRLRLRCETWSGIVTVKNVRRIGRFRRKSTTPLGGFAGLWRFRGVVLWRSLFDKDLPAGGVCSTAVKVSGGLLGSGGSRVAVSLAPARWVRSRRVLFACHFFKLRSRATLAAHEAVGGML